MGCNCGRSRKVSQQAEKALGSETEGKRERTQNTKSTSNRMSKLAMLKKIWKESK